MRFKIVSTSNLNRDLDDARFRYISNVATFTQHPGERKVDYDRLDDWRHRSRFYFAP
ncbi:hypothetical protein AGR4A_Cc190107 [Agrobacterium tumefaciens str. B6]|uniref:Uncharacterized protein n=2 Tax=Agrobacterium tumefaciens TaxID=358 RepID=A0A822UYG3_AGRTU|nr:hypothetical protein AGR4C_Cc100097 [Agrobacterium tumefaciens str. Kerr 14]CVI15378.1 hypothetical protein AGR4A_Cc190107 [Agrobacterium tumefaciens str. B6]